MIELSFEQKEETGYRAVRERLEAVSPYGVKRLREEGFYGPEQREALEKELDNVAVLREALTSDGTAMQDLRQKLSGLKELSGTFDRLSAGCLTEVELFELAAFCRRLQELIPRAQALPGYDRLTGVRFVSADGALRVLDPSASGRMTFYVEDGRSKALQAARDRKRRLERQLRELRGGKPAEGREERELIRGREEAAAAEEAALQEIYGQMSEALRPFLPVLKTDAAAAGRLDAGIAKALLAERFGCVRPGIGGEALRFSGAVHPPVAEALAKRNRSFAPIDIELPRGVTALTGANMGGKSVALKTVVLNTLLALGGCFVFADAAEVPLFERLELITRDLSDAERGLSSFGGEVLRLGEALDRLKEGGLSLIVMDELARGTNVQEGEAIACGTVKYLSGKKAVTLLATHYDAAAAAADRHYQVKGLKKLEKEPGTAFSGTGLDALRRIEEAMDYGLIPVEAETACPRDAFTVCRLLGLPEEILSGERARPER